ncbi:MAG: hypothetical protein FJ225_01960 [Lentisphaerae bacterium]|nr:hypothetical protein [Lentisphaerota bacterium]
MNGHIKRILAVRTENPFFAVLAFVLVGLAVALLVSPICPLALAPGLVLLVALVLGRWPEIGIYVIAAVIPFGTLRGFTGDFSFIRIHWLVGAFLAFLLVFHVLPSKQPMRNLRSGIWLRLLVFFVLAVLAMLFSPYRMMTLQALPLYVAGYLFVAVTMAFLPRRGLTHRLPAVILISIAAGIVMGLWLYASGRQERVSGGAISPNNMALMIIFSIPLLVYWAFHARRRLARLIIVPLVALSMAGLVTTYSRSGAIVFVATAVGIFLAHKRRLTPRKFGLVLSAGALALALVVALVPSAYWKRQAAIGDESDPAMSRRKAYVACATDAFRQRPLLGWGPSAFQYYWADSYYGRQYRTRGKREATVSPEEQYRRTAHNTYLEVLVGNGLLGLAAFLAVLGFAYRDFLRAEKTFRQRGAEAMAQLVASYRVAYLSVLLYLLFFSDVNHKYLLLSLALSQVCRRESGQPSPEDAAGPDAAPDAAGRRTLT